MATKSNVNTMDRSLRLLPLFLCLPALGFLLPHGLIAHSFLPAVGIVPLAISAVSSVVFLAQKRGNETRRCDFGVLLDFILAVSHIAVLIPTWILVSEQNCGWRRTYQYHRCTPRLVMLGTYGTMFLMINFIIHSWFVLRTVPSLLRSMTWSRPGYSPLTTCPHCDGNLNGSMRTRRGKQPMCARPYNDNDGEDMHAPLFIGGIAGKSTGQRESEESADHDARPSTDDDSARLIV